MKPARNYSLRLIIPARLVQPSPHFQFSGFLSPVIRLGFPCPCWPLPFAGCCMHEDRSGVRLFVPHFVYNMNRACYTPTTCSARQECSYKSRFVFCSPARHPTRRMLRNPAANRPRYGVSHGATPFGTSALKESLESLHNASEKDSPQHPPTDLPSSSQSVSRHSKPGPHQIRQSRLAQPAATD